MRLTIDTTTIKFAAAGAAEPVLDFATKSQKTDEHSVPLFQVPVFSAGGGIKDAFTVKVAGEVKGLGCTYELRGREGVKRPGFHRGFDLHWVLLPIPVLNSGGLFFLHRQFELDRREVAEVAVETLVVVPVHPSEGLQFEIVNGPPRTVRRDSAPKKFATHQRRLNRSTFHW